MFTIPSQSIFLTFFLGGGCAQNCLRPSYYKEKILYDKMDSKIKLLHVIIGLINKGKKATNGRAIFFLRLYVACKSCGSLEPFKTFQNCKKLFLSHIAQALQWMPKDLNEVCSPTASSRSSHECLLVNYCSQLTFFFFLNKRGRITKQYEIRPLRTVLPRKMQLAIKKSLQILSV